MWRQWPVAVFRKAWPNVVRCRTVAVVGHRTTVIDKEQRQQANSKLLHGVHDSLWHKASNGDVATVRNLCAQVDVGD